ncbi:hypothetical protein NS201_09565 [Pseudomonas oryzihabitans]|nr:hypothetical protein NS201_09565 [Pseudomonas psychrotolerans]
MAVTATQVESLYLAYFGRPAEPAGLAYWTAQTNATVDQISAAFAQQPEYTNVYGGLTRTQVVNTLYQNLFGRSAQSNELNYWVNSTDVTVDRLALALTNGATGIDRLTLDGKTQFASQLTANAVSTATASDVKAALTNATIIPSVTNGTAAAGQTLSAYLTANPTKSAGDFYSLATTQAANSLKFITNGNVLTDGNGVNVTNSGTSTAAAYSVNFGANTTAGVVTLNNASGTETLNLVAANKATDVTLSGTSGLASGTAAATSITLAEAASTPIVTTVHLNVSDAAVAATSTTIGLGGLTALTTIDGANSTSALTLGTTGTHLSLAGLTSLTTGSGNDVLFVDTASNTSSVKAAALTISTGAGNDQVTSTVNDGALTINTGAGNDTITATATGKAALTINGGAGVDTVVIGSTASGSTAATVAHNVSITLGDGADTVSLATTSTTNNGTTTTTTNAFQTVQAYTAVTSSSTAAQVSAADTALKAGLVTVTDFNTSVDTLALGSLGTVTLTNAQIGAISAASSLSQAVQLAASDITGSTVTGKAVAFQYGSDTYVFVNNSDATSGTATVDNGDGLIQLSGVTATQLSSANFTHA